MEKEICIYWSRTKWNIIIHISTTTTTTTTKTYIKDEEEIKKIIKIHIDSDSDAHFKCDDIIYYLQYG